MTAGTVADFLRSNAPRVPEQPSDSDLVWPGASQMIRARADLRQESKFWDGDVDDDFLIAPLLARGRGHALYAPAKEAKSFVVLQAVLGACVPGGPSWIDPPAEPLSAMYLDYEMTEADFIERVEGFGYSRKDDFSRLHYVYAGALGFDLDTPDGGHELVAQALAWDVDLVVIDTFGRAIAGEENSADTLRNFYKYTGAQLKHYGFTYLRLDHAGKDSGKGQRGTSAKADDVDVVWQLSRTDTGVTLKRTHSRVSWVPESVNLRYERNDDGLARHVRADHAGYPPGTAEKAAEWLALDLPLDASRRDAKAAGLKFEARKFPAIKRYVTERLGLP